MGILLWPFVAVWRLFALIVGLTGRLIGIVLGLVLVLVGGLVSATVVGLPIGLPLVAVGLLLIARGLF